MKNIEHRTVNDLLTNINPYKRTFTNYASVFGIDLSSYFIGAPIFFTEQQTIHNELYLYFKENKSFVDKFYGDWHRQKTMKQLAEEIQQDVSNVLNLFNSGSVFMNRSLPGFNFTEETTFRYYSSFQIIELLTGKQVVERPKELYRRIYINDKIDKVIDYAVKELPNPIKTELTSASWEKDFNAQDSPYSFPCQINLTFKKENFTWILEKYSFTIFH